MDQVQGVLIKALPSSWQLLNYNALIYNSKHQMGNLQLIHEKCGELWEETKPSHPILVINGQKVYSVLPIAKWALKSPSSMRDFSSAWKTLNRIILQYVTTTVVSFIFHYFFFLLFKLLSIAAMPSINTRLLRVCELEMERLYDWGEFMVEMRPDWQVH